MKGTLSPKDLAAAIGVSESSLRRWVDSGALKTARTVGGHRRIPIAEAVRFLRQTQTVVLRPELLGWTSPTENLSLDQQILEALKLGESGQVRGLLLSLYTGGQSVAAICDGPLRWAMHRLGELWKHDQRGILVEHRATATCLEALAQFQQVLPTPPADAPLALGGAPEGDPYLIPSAMAAMVLQEAGYRTINFGGNTPVQLLADAARERRAAVVWLSMTTRQRRQKLAGDVTQLVHRLQATGAQLVVGGQQAALAGNPPGLCKVQSMFELAAFARGRRPG